MAPSATTRDSISPPSWGEWAVVWAAALAAIVPFFLSPLAPGGDTGWHAAVVGVIANPDGYLGYFDSDPGWGSYRAVYSFTALLASVTGPELAIRLLLAVCGAGLVLASHRLLRAFGRDGTMAVLAAPAVWSTTLAFGFVAYVPSLPLGILTWALSWEFVTGKKTLATTLALCASWLGVCLCHPFAAAVVGGGVVVLGLCGLSRDDWRRAAGLVAILVVFSLPAALSLAAVGDAGGPRIPGLAEAPFLSRLTTQVFVDPLESIVAWPVRLFGFGSDALRFAIAFAGLAAVLVAARLGGPVSAYGIRRRAPLYLVVSLVLVYLITPFTFEWPRNWYGAQPRILPLIWIALLVVLAPGPGPRRATLPPALVAAAALLLLWFAPLRDFAREAADLDAVIAASGEGQRTLTLVEGRRTVDRRAPEPWRHASGHLVAERGGYASHLPMATRDGLNTGHHIPVFLSDRAPSRPSAHQKGAPRTFRWHVAAEGWTQFLVRDRNPSDRFPYFRGHSHEIELVARRGRWSLYRRRYLQP